MKVSGFSFVRNALINDYPIKEAITSILPVCNHFYVAVGASSDGTLEYVDTIDPGRITILPTVWEDTLRTGGRVFAAETNKAMDVIDTSSDWLFYIQADECVHEKYLPVIKEAMIKYNDDLRVDGLLFNYLHFYGSYDHVGTSRRWYRKEIRVIRNNRGIRSYKDAQGFRKNGAKLNVKQIDAFIYHYGWAKSGLGMAKKARNFGTFYNGTSEIAADAEFDYSNADRLNKFKGTHPAVMRDRIKSAPIHLPTDFDSRLRPLSLRRSALQFFEDITGYRLGEYKNYHVI